MLNNHFDLRSGEIDDVFTVRSSNCKDAWLIRVQKKDGSITTIGKADSEIHARLTIQRFFSESALKA